MRKIIIMGMGVVMFAGMVNAATASRTVAGASTGGNSPFATDAYPGFDGLDDVKKPERREKSWWFGVKRPNSAEQFKFAEELEKAGDFKAASKAYDALVREWPAAVEAPKAQLAFAKLLADKLEDWEEAFEQVEYLLDFYSRDCEYLEMVKYSYELVDLMIKNKKTMFGLSFLSNRQVRQHYESVVRHAPGADYVPQAMLKIADLREQDQQYEESVKVYASLQSKFPLTEESRKAAYLEARARMWLCRRLAYNVPRCVDTLGYLNLTIEKLSDKAQQEELKTWVTELKQYLEEDDYKRAKFYDSRQRTRHAARNSWEKYLKDHPNSIHAEEVKARIEKLTDPVSKVSTTTEEQKEMEFYK